MPLTGQKTHKKQLLYKSRLFPLAANPAAYVVRMQDELLTLIAKIVTFPTLSSMFTKTALLLI